MKAKTIISFLESVAPLYLQEEYDNSGLLTGSEENEIQGVLITLDCTEDVVDEALKKNCNLIIAHHPIIFKGLKKITGKTYVERTVEKAIRNNISIYAIHTNLDNVQDGVNKKICEKLGLINCRILRYSGTDKKTGSGMVGYLKKPADEQSFLSKVKKTMKAGMIRHTRLRGKKIKKVAVCGGSGSFLLPDAICQNADAFITADFKYHQFFDGEGKTVIIDVGHYESEQFTKELLMNLLIANFSIFATRFKKRQKNLPFHKAGIPLFISEINTNPINYL